MLVPSMVLGLGTMAYPDSTDALFHAGDRQRGFRPNRPKAKGAAAHPDFHAIISCRNAILPVITVLGPSIAAITTGGFVVETRIRDSRASGATSCRRSSNLDYTVIMGTTVFYGAVSGGSW